MSLLCHNWYHVWFGYIFEPVVLYIVLIITYCACPRDIVFSHFVGSWDKFTAMHVQIFAFSPDIFNRLVLFYLFLCSLLLQFSSLVYGYYAFCFWKFARVQVISCFSSVISKYNPNLQSHLSLGPTICLVLFLSLSSIVELVKNFQWHL